MELIVDGTHVKILNNLFHFLAAWRGRPISLTPMAYEWCSAIFESVGRLGPSRMDSPSLFSNRLLLAFGLRSRRNPEFRIPLQIAFRLVGPPYNEVLINYKSHHDRVFETAFSSHADDVIADATCAWIICDPRPTSSCANYFARRMGNPKPFSKRLRRVAIHAIEENESGELAASDVVLVRLLNRLDAVVGDLGDGEKWVRLLSNVIRSKVEEKLASHYWHLLGELVLTKKLCLGVGFGMRDVEVMRSLRDAKDWEKLEDWMVVVWGPILSGSIPCNPTSVLEGIEDATSVLEDTEDATPVLEDIKDATPVLEDIQDATLDLLSSRPSAFQRLKALIDGLRLVGDDIPMARLEEVLNKARARRLPPEPQHPPYVSVRPSLFLFVLTLPFFPSSQSVLTESLVPLLFTGDDTFS